MLFKNRSEAGVLLAKRLAPYRHKDVVIYAIPRGGVIVAIEIALKLQAPIDVIITKKIGYPSNAEYALAATTGLHSEVAGDVVLDAHLKKWLQAQTKLKMEDIVKRKKIFSGETQRHNCKGKIAILVDDGVATGLTLKAALHELKEKQPNKIVVAVPIIPDSAVRFITNDIDELVALRVSSDESFLGSVGSYYADFEQVSDSEVIAALRRWNSY